MSPIEPAPVARVDRVSFRPMEESRSVRVLLPGGARLLYVYEKQRDLPAGQLLHMAYLTELRLALRAPASEWQVVGLEEDWTGQTPDALWFRDGGAWAVEIDLGNYRRMKVFSKLRHYDLAYQGQVWGVLEEGKRARLELLAQALELKKPVWSLIVTEPALAALGRSPSTR